MKTAGHFASARAVAKEAFPAGERDWRIGGIGLAAAMVLLAGCGSEAPAPAEPASPPEAAAAASADVAAPVAVDVDLSFVELIEGQAARVLRAYPEGATQLGVAERIAGEGYLSRLADYSPAGAAEMKAMNAAFLAELDAASRDALGEAAKVNFDILKNAYELAARRNAFAFGGAAPAGASPMQVGSSWAVTPYLVTQLTGPHLAIPRMLQTQHPIESRTHIEAYLARLEAIGPAFDGVAATLEADAAEGVVPPIFAIDGVVTSTRAFIESAPEAHPLVATLTEKMAKVEGLTDAERDAYGERARALVETVVYPAYVRLGVAMDGLRTRSGADAGVWRLGEKGAAFYQMALDSYGGGGRDGDAVHALGLAEVARITAEMDAILKGLGLAEGTVAERLGVIASREGALFPNTDEGRETLLDYLRGEIAAVNAVAPQWFGALPKQTVEVRRIPVYEENSSPGGYYSGPSLDGTRPGIYWINLKNTEDNPKYGLKTLTFHEAVPGHHFQISLQRSISDFPLMRNLLSYSEYSEGWALYGEALAREMGIYDGDPEGDLGRLQAELFRAARLVVDTGLHHKRWSREEAIEYMVAATGESRAGVTREIERYAVVPGQACAYKLGMLRIQEMRARAEAELGEAFDIRAFHDAILLAGAMPMDPLEARVNEWIADRKP